GRVATGPTALGPGPRGLHAPVGRGQGDRAPVVPQPHGRGLVGGGRLVEREPHALAHAVDGEPPRVRPRRVRREARPHLAHRVLRGGGLPPVVARRGDLHDG